MQRLQAFKYELMANGAQERSMRQFAGACRFVYNKALAFQKTNYETGAKFIGYEPMAKILTQWRNADQTPWLKDAPVHPLQHALKDLERAYKNFFAKRASFPRFKKRGSGQSFRYPDPKQIKFDPSNARIFLPKLGWMRLRLSRPVLGELRNVTVSQSGGKWFVSIQTQRDISVALPTSTSAIGIDMGIARFVTMSDGTFIAPLNSFKRHQQRLAKYQRRMSRKVKWSCNWKKAKSKVQRVHADIANARRDFLHKASTALADSHAMVCIEDLAVGNMSRTAKGSVNAPGRKVKQKAGLNRSIVDQGWFEFRRQLEYKMQWSGGMLLAVPAHHTSQTCPECGHVAKENRTSQSLFLCVACGHTGNADEVGAINILERGQRLLACGEDGSGRGRKTKAQPASVKQEPAEATMHEAAHA
jgi:putative transposase